MLLSSLRLCCTTPGRCLLLAAALLAVWLWPHDPRIQHPDQAAPVTETRPRPPQTTQSPPSLQQAAAKTYADELRLLHQHAQELDPDAFFLAHATLCQGLEELGADTLTTTYIQLLQEALKRPDVKAVVHDDPLALVLWHQGASVEELTAYRQQRDWLADHLAMLRAEPERPSSGASQRNSHLKILRVVLADAELAQAVAEDAGLGIYGLAMLVDHHQLLAEAWRRYQLDLAPLIAVLAMNTQASTYSATQLAQIARHHPQLWHLAQLTPDALALFAAAPQEAEVVLSQYGETGIGQLILQRFAHQSDVICQACRAVQCYGDLAIHIFARHADPLQTRLLAEHLRDPSVGIRIVPFLARFGDTGFERLAQDRAWLDRYFHADGSNKVDPGEWISAVPGGAIVQVLRHWSAGYPCEWSELGWAGFDVAEGIILVASLGTGTAITSGIKHGAKQGAQQALTTGSRQWTRKELRQVFRRHGKSLTGLSRSARQTARLSTTQIARLLPGLGLQACSAALRRTTMSCKHLVQRWHHVPVHLRSLCYRSLLGLGLLITIHERTLPRIDLLAAAMGEFAADVAAGTVALAGKSLSQAADQLSARVLPAWLPAERRWLLLCILSMLLAWQLRRWWTPGPMRGMAGLDRPQAASQPSPSQPSHSPEPSQRSQVVTAMQQPAMVMLTAADASRPGPNTQLRPARASFRQAPAPRPYKGLRKRRITPRPMTFMATLLCCSLPVALWFPPLQDTNKNQEVSAPDLQQTIANWHDELRHQPSTAQCHLIIDGCTALAADAPAELARDLRQLRRTATMHMQEHVLAAAAAAMVDPLEGTVRAIRLLAKHIEKHPDGPLSHQIQDQLQAYQQAHRFDMRRRMYRHPARTLAQTQAKLAFIEAHPDCWPSHAEAEIKAALNFGHWLCNQPEVRVTLLGAGSFTEAQDPKVTVTLTQAGQRCNWEANSSDVRSASWQIMKQFQWLGTGTLQMNFMEDDTFADDDIASHRSTGPHLLRYLCGAQELSPSLPEWQAALSDCRIRFKQERRLGDHWQIVHPQEWTRYEAWVAQGYAWTSCASDVPDQQR